MSNNDFSKYVGPSKKVSSKEYELVARNNFLDEDVKSVSYNNRPLPLHL